MNGIMQTIRYLHTIRRYDEKQIEKFVLQQIPKAEAIQKRGAK